jgi:hypothetical protein
MNFQGSRSFLKNGFKNMNKSFFNNKYSFKMLNTNLNSKKFHTLFSNNLMMNNIFLLNACKNLKTNLFSSSDCGFMINQDASAIKPEDPQNLAFIENGNFLLIRNFPH